MKKSERKITKKLIEKQLEQVIDPELGISIVDLGLIYEIKINGKQVDIKMTLTTIGCPLFSLIEHEVKEKLTSLGIEESNIRIELTFDPPWSMDRMSPAAKALLGI